MVALGSRARQPRRSESRRGCSTGKRRGACVTVYIVQSGVQFAAVNSSDFVRSRKVNYVDDVREGRLLAGGTNQSTGRWGGMPARIGGLAATAGGVGAAL